MKNALSTLILVTGLASMASMCNKPPVNPINTVDAGPGPIFVVDGGGDSYDQACANIQTVGCSEGMGSNCAIVMRDAESKKLEFYDADCLKNAKSKEAIRNCGNKKVKCP